MNRKITSFEMTKDEQNRFEFAFSLSGFRHKSEFIRYMIFESIKEFYGDLNDTRKD